MQSSNGSAENSRRPDRANVPNVSSRQTGNHGMARYEQSGKSNYIPREARSTWVDFLLNKQPYPLPKNELRHPPKGGSTTPFPFKNQAKYLKR
jgi:hypothetical protein